LATQNTKRISGRVDIRKYALIGMSNCII